MSDTQMAAPNTMAGMRKITMGLGDAVKRLIHVEASYRMGFHAIPEQALIERDMIVMALNQIDLDLGFDCDGDGVVDVPNTVDIFVVSAQTSCCRIQAKDGSRSPALPAAASISAVPPAIPDPDMEEIVAIPEIEFPAKVRGQTRQTTEPKKKGKGLFGLFATDKDKDAK